MARYGERPTPSWPASNQVFRAEALVGLWAASEACAQQYPVKPIRMVVGYAGWGPGQLDQEIAASGWLTMDVDPTLIFNTPPDQMWEAALKRLGADPAGLQRSIGVH